jgi:hypothetical protein
MVFVGETGRLRSDTVEGLSEDAVRLGDVCRVGGALLQVTRPRIPFGHPLGQRPRRRPTAEACHQLHLAGDV